MRDQRISPSKVLSNPSLYPGERLWGYQPLCELLGTNGVDVYYAATGKSVGLIRKLLRHLAAKLFGDMTIRISLLRRLYAERRDVEAVFITDNSAVFTLLLMRYLPGFSFRVYPLLLGWVEFKFSQMSAWQRRVWLSLLQRANGVLALGIEEAEELRRLGLDNVRFLDFGVDTEFWSPGESLLDDYVFSVGADLCRDYETFVDAAEDLPAIICAPARSMRGLKLRENITRVEGSQLDVRHWFRQARIVVIPIHDTLRPSGQVCIVQAMATGKAVITTRTRGRWSDLLVDGENCILVPPNDLNALRGGIMDLYGDEVRISKIGRRARQTVLEHFTVDHFARSIALNTEVPSRLQSS
jgi:glycosyltransferase involved in cell wall biosynthesis